MGRSQRHRPRPGQAVDAISSIRGTIQALDQISAAIAAAVEEQSAVTREMSGTMQAASHGVAGIANSRGDCPRQ